MSRLIVQIDNEGVQIKINLFFLFFGQSDNGTHNVAYASQKYHSCHGASNNQFYHTENITRTPQKKFDNKRYILKPFDKC